MAQSRSVFFLMSGPAHLPYLVTSLASLRNYWQGLVEVYAWPDCYPYAKMVAEDPRLDIVVLERTPEYRGKNGQFADKISLCMSFKNRRDLDIVCYLDADTLIYKPIDRIFDVAELVGFAATQFNGWVSTGRVRGRIERLKQFKELDQRIIDRTLREEWPSVNGGIWAARPTSPVLYEWLRWTWTAKNIFIADETALHPIQVMFTERKQFDVVRGGGFNASPKFVSIPRENVTVWHGHGNCFTRPQKSPEGVAMWWNWYQKCLQNNIGRMAEWIDDVRPTNKWLKELEAK